MPFYQLANIQKTPISPLGQLGRTLEKSNIYASATTKGKKLYTTKKYQYLILKNCKKKNWQGVLLNNGRIGYMEEKKVAKLPYQVRQKMVDPRKTIHTSRSSLANYSLSYIGVPYKFGGSCFENGIDCSSFVQKLYGKIGMTLPRTAAEQALVGTPINRLEHLKPGDRLYFWEKRRNKIGHTGIYIGNGCFVHSSSGRKGVATDRLDLPAWKNTLVAARR